MSLSRRSLLLANPTLLGAGPVAAPRMADPPAGADSGMPFLASDHAGEALLSWLEPGEGKRFRLQFARWRQSGWGDPETIASSDNWFINWADFPSVVALPNGTLLAHWLERAGQGKYGYGIRIARRAAGGGEWTPVFHAPPSDPEDYSGFLAFVSRGDVLGASYLAPPAVPEAGHRKTLRFVEFNADGQAMGDRELDPDVCSCCQTAVIATATGPLVAYRDHQPGEIRDISVVRKVGADWTAPQPLHEDGWVINGCPTEGPALAVVGRNIGAAWLTRARDTARVQVSFSTNQGRSFGSPIRVDGGNPMGRPAAAILGDRLLAAWIEKNGTTAELRLRVVAASGALGPPVTVTPVASARSAGCPKIAVVGSKVLLAWRDTRVRAGWLPEKFFSL